MRTSTLWAIAVLLVLSSVVSAAVSRVVGLAVATRDGTEVGVLCPFTVVAVKGSGKYTINAVKIDAANEVAALSALHYAQAVADQFKYDSNFKKYDIHIEYEEKYVAHIGGSGGAAKALGIVGAMARLPLRQDIAITGDTSQTGVIGEVGGIPEKITAAAEGGMRTVIIPLANAADVPPLPEAALLRCQIVLAASMRDVFFHTFGAAAPGQYYELFWTRRTDALKKYQAADWLGCRQGLRDALQLYPGDLSLTRLLAFAEEFAEAEEDASTCFARAASNEKEGDLCAALDLYALAVADLQKARRPLDGHLAAIEACAGKAKAGAEALAAKGDFMRAARLLENLVRLYPNDPTLRASYKKAYDSYIAELQAAVSKCLVAEDFDGARERVAPEVKLMPDDENLRSLQAQIRKAEGAARFAQGCRLLDGGKPVEAEVAFRAAQELGYDKGAIGDKLAVIRDAAKRDDVARADRLFEEGKYEEAGKLYEELLPVVGSKDAVASRLHECKTALVIGAMVDEAVQKDDFARLLAECKERPVQRMALKLLKQKEKTPRVDLVRVILVRRASSDGSASARADFAAVDQGTALCEPSAKEKDALAAFRAGDRTACTAALAAAEKMTALGCLLRAAAAANDLSPIQPAKDRAIEVAQWTTDAAWCAPACAELQAVAAAAAATAGMPALARMHLEGLAALSPGEEGLVASGGLFAQLCIATGSVETAVCKDICTAQAKGIWGYPFYLSACALKRSLTVASPAEDQKTFKSYLVEAAGDPLLRKYCTEACGLQSAWVPVLRQYLKHCLLTKGETLSRMQGRSIGGRNAVLNDLLAYGDWAN